MEDLVKEMKDSGLRRKNIMVLVEKRCSNIDYLRRILQRYNAKARIYWMNVVSIDTDSLVRNVEKRVRNKRTKIWFLLGVNFSKLLRIQNIPTYIRSSAQMLEEFDYFISNMSSSVSTSTFSKAPSMIAKASVNLDNEFEVVKPKLHKIGNTVTYEFLITFNIPCELDYFQIIYALCEVLKLVYSKFDDDCCSNKHIYETVMKMDSRIKHHFLSVLEKEIHQFAKNTLREQVSDLESIFKAWDM